MAEEGTGTGGENAKQEPPCCYRHPSEAATALCVSCARPVCRECDRRAGYLHYCPQCRPFIPIPATYRVPPPYPAPPPYPVPPPFRLEPPEPADEREKRWWRASWSLKEVVIALLLVFGLYNALSLVLLLTTGNPFFYSYLSYALVFCPLIAFSIWYIVRRHHRGWKELGIRWGKPGRTLLAGGLGSLVALAFSYGAYFIIFLLFYLLAGRAPVNTESENLKGAGGGTVAMVLLTVVVLAPIFEELFFRGLFYPALRRRLGPSMAVFLNGLIFGALHFQPLFMISLILVGVVLAYMYERTDSLFAPMLTHAFYNLVVMLITIFAGW